MDQIVPPSNQLAHVGSGRVHVGRPLAALGEGTLAAGGTTGDAGGFSSGGGYDIGAPVTPKRPSFATPLRREVMIFSRTLDAPPLASHTALGALHGQASRDGGLVSRQGEGVLTGGSLRISHDGAIATELDPPGTPERVSGDFGEEEAAAAATEPLPPEVPKSRIALPGDDAAGERVYERVSGDFSEQEAAAAAAAASGEEMGGPELSEGFVCPICMATFATKAELLACIQSH